MIVKEQKYADITLEKEDKEVLQNTRDILLYLLDVSNKYGTPYYNVDGIYHDNNEISNFIDFVEDFYFYDSKIILEKDNKT